MAWYDSILNIFQQPKTQTAVPVASHISGGTVWSNGVVTPAGRGYYGPSAVGTATPVPTPYQSQVPNGQVLGANTSSNTNPGSIIFQPGQVPTGPSDDEINASYAPAFDVLNKQVDYLRNNELPAALGDIEKGRTKLQGELTEQEAATKAATDRETGILQQNKQSALDEAIRSFNILNQNLKSRFGGGSSAGVASSEIGQQEFYRQQGGISQSFQNQLGALLQKQTDLYLGINKYRQKINDDSQTQIDQAKRELENRLNALQSQMGMLESDKRQKKLAIIQDSVNFARQISAQKISAQLQLESYRQQTEIALKAQYDQLSSQQIDTSSNVFSPYTKNQYLTPASQTPQTQTPIRNLTRTKPEDDEISYFTNPFFSTG